MAGIEQLLGKVLESVSVVGYEKIIFKTTDGETFSMHHEQDCCEDVSIDDIEGDIESLVGNPILVAEEVESNESRDPSQEFDSFTWTFYKLATIKGHVDIRWFGSSNGYYSESVDFVRVKA